MQWVAMKATDPQGVGGPPAPPHAPRTLPRLRSPFHDVIIHRPLLSPVPTEPGAQASEVPTRSGTPSVASSDAESDSSDEDEEQEDEDDEEEEGGRASSELHGEEWDEEERMSTVQEGDVIYLELRRPRLGKPLLPLIDTRRGVRLS